MYVHGLLSSVVLYGCCRIGAENAARRVGQLAKRFLVWTGYAVTDKAIIEHRVCIAGGGVEDIMLGYLLACSNVSVVVLEKYGDFLRDLRG
ncbi:MAG TPA: hypothetical protein VL027_00295 [Spongiibacteraceae bacterium]|jgi:hypothetical protein|nr:hypothetical protein [Spongiibacteraceae bacterium]HUH36361.1 hypothetical protein [Spongiibacteraceae bacterium]